MLLTGRELDRRGTRHPPVADRRTRSCSRASGFRRLRAGAGSLPRRARRGHGCDRRRHERRCLRARGARGDAADAARARALLAGVLVAALAVGLARQAGAGRIEVLGGIAAALLLAAARRRARACPSGALDQPAGAVTAPRSRSGSSGGAAFVIEGGWRLGRRLPPARPRRGAGDERARAGCLRRGDDARPFLGPVAGEPARRHGAARRLDGRGARRARRRRVGSEPAGRDRGVLRRRRGDLDRSARALRRRRPPHLARRARQRPRDGDDARLPRLPRRAAGRGRYRRGGRAEGELRRARRDRDRAHRRGAASAPERTCPRDCPQDTS